MTEQELKFLYKWAIQNSRRHFTPEEKEVLKQAIDQCETLEDLIAVAVTAATVN